MQLLNIQNYSVPGCYIFEVLVFLTKVLIIFSVEFKNFSFSRVGFSSLEPYLASVLGGVEQFRFC